MIESLQPADFVLCGLTVVMTVTGLFRGFSGTLAFVLATVVAILAGMFGWSRSAELTDVMWMRGAGTLVGALLTFGIVRLIVKKLVGGLLAQPSDALFGGLLGALVGVLLVAVWAHAGLYLEYSTIVRTVADLLPANI